MINYFKIIKPGIILGNLTSVIGGFCFSKSAFSTHLLFFVLFGTFCIIASGCIFNNIIDIDIDKKMLRTKSRILIYAKFFKPYCKFLGILLFFLGNIVLLIKVNIISALLAIIGFYVYVVLYSLYFKRTSMYSVIIGGISGAIPPMIGYCSTTNYIDHQSILLFLVFFVWQIPHSYSILIFYKTDYHNANIPTVVEEKGVLKSILDIIIFIVIFCTLIILLYVFNYVHLLFFIITISLSLLWLLIALIYYKNFINLYLSKLLFLWSILVIFSFNVMLIVNKLYFLQTYIRFW